VDKLQARFNNLNLAETLVFVISGAAAAKQRGLDLFGIVATAFTVACGRGVIRDVCIGAIPPSELTNWYYLVAVIVATGMTIGLYTLVRRFIHPALFFDTLNLSSFAIKDAQKCLP